MQDAFSQVSVPVALKPTPKEMALPVEVTPCKKHNEISQLLIKESFYRYGFTDEVNELIKISDYQNFMEGHALFDPNTHTLLVHPHEDAIVIIKKEDGSTAFGKKSDHFGNKSAPTRESNTISIPQRDQGFISPAAHLDI